MDVRVAVTFHSVGCLTRKPVKVENALTVLSYAPISYMAPWKQISDAESSGKIISLQSLKVSLILAGLRLKPTSSGALISFPA